LFFLLHVAVGVHASDTKYSVMSVEEAGHLVEKLIHDDLYGPGGSWELPKMTPNARGVRIGKDDFVVFAPVETTEVTLAPLDECVPALFAGMKTDAYTTEIVGGDGTRLVQWRTAGILFSSTDLEMENPVFQPKGGACARGKQVLPKRGFRWNLSSVGVELRTRYSEIYLVPFDAPIPDIFTRFAGGTTVFLGEFSFAGEYLTLTIATKAFKLRPVLVSEPAK
jgi:hypothetical protein